MRAAGRPANPLGAALEGVRYTHLREPAYGATQGSPATSVQGLMMSMVVALAGPNELRHFVRTMLCDHDRLDPDSVPFYEGLMMRAGRVCGLYFEVQGPRLMRAHAIWVGEEHRILFYDSTGSRFAEVRLSEAPDPGEWTREESSSEPAATA